MVYNTTFMNNVTNLADLSIGISTSIGNSYLIGNMILLAFFIVYLALGRKEDIFTVLISDSLLTSIIAMLLFGIGMVTSYAIIIPVILFVILLVFRMST